MFNFDEAWEDTLFSSIKLVQVVSVYVVPASPLAPMCPSFSWHVTVSVPPVPLLNLYLLYLYLLYLYLMYMYLVCLYMHYLFLHLFHPAHLPPGHHSCHVSQSVPHYFTQFYFLELRSND